MKKLLFVTLIALFFNRINAQYVKIGDGDFSSTTVGPFRVSSSTNSFFSKYAFLYTKTVLGNLKHLDTITSLELELLAGSSLNGNTLLDIYVKNTDSLNFGTGTKSWNTLTTNATLIFSGSLLNIIDAQPGFKKISINNNSWVYDTTKGKNLAIFFAYSQTATQPGNVNVVFDGTNFGYQNNTVKFMTGTNNVDSLNISSLNHPTIVLNYPRIKNEVTFLKAYSLGKMPVPIGNPDSVRILVRNTGKNKLTNWPIYLTIRGANNIKDTSYITLDSAKQTFITLKAVSVLNQGLDSIFVTAKNSSLLGPIVKTYRNNNNNLYSYEDPLAKGSAGGIGFNGTTGDFLARFYSNGGKAINQVNTIFGQTGRLCRIAIWDDKGVNKKPGKIIWQSDTFNTTVGKTTINIKNPITINGGFYAGVRQLDNTNVGFGFQPEEPVRPNTFLFSAPTGDTNWVDFAPNAPFRFLIEPRVQADTDVAVISIQKHLNDTLIFNSLDSFSPICTLKNLGLRNFNSPFTVKCVIDYFGFEVYNQTFSDTLSPNASRVYKFPKQGNFIRKGQHRIRFICNYAGDQIKDNDTLSSNVFIGVKNDCGVLDLYEPTKNKYYRELLDTIIPLFITQNFSYNTMANINHRCVFKQGNKVVYDQKITKTFIGGQSFIFNLDPYITKDTGLINVLVFTEFKNDVQRNNDTIKSQFFVKRFYDMAMDSMYLTKLAGKYKENTNINFRYRVKNIGLSYNNGSKVVVNVKTESGLQVFTDTANIGFLAQNETAIGDFTKKYKPLKKGFYFVDYSSIYPLDFYKSNDVISQRIVVGYPLDYQADTIFSPTELQTFILSKTTKIGPKVRFKNNGFVPLSSTLIPVVCEIWKNNILYYYDIKSTSIDTGKTLTIDFPQNFIANLPGKFTIRAYTNFNGDMFKENDTFTRNFIVQVDKDAQATSTTIPTNYFAKETTAKLNATFSNNGFATMTNVKVFAALDNVIVDSTSINFTPYGNNVVTFNYVFAPTKAGIVRYTYFVAKNSDSFLVNDTLFTNLFVKARLDASVTLETANCNKKVVENRDMAIVKATVQNLGVDSINNKTLTLYIYNANGAIIHKQQLPVNAIPSSSFVNFQSTPVALTTLGVYTYTASISPDLFPQNDSAFCAATYIVNSTKQAWASNIKIYPVPASNTITVANAPVTATYTILTAQGKKVSTHVQPIIDISNIAAGLYILQVNYGQQNEVFIGIKQ